MGRHALTVLESPWDTDDGDIAKHSMRPFVEGLCEFHEWSLIYRTFTSSHELARLLGGEAFDRKSDRSLLYIASHGGPGRLQAGIRDPVDINIAQAAEKLVKEVDGVWIGACDVGMSTSLRRFAEHGGALWAGGYTTSVDWDSCMLIDLAILNEAMRTSRPKSRKDVLSLFKDALLRFDGEFCVGEDDDGEHVELERSLCIWGRDQGRPPQDLTEDVLDALEWGDEEDEDDDD